MKKFIVSTLILVSAFSLSGCFGGTPKCGDKETKDLVIQIAKDELINQGLSKIIPSLSFTVKHIRTIKHDKDTDSYKCDADFEMIGDKIETIPITYSVIMTDDGENFYVHVLGFRK